MKNVISKMRIIRSCIAVKNSIFNKQCNNKINFAEN